MIASLVAVGSELLLPGRADTNSDWLTRRLDRLGLVVKHRAIVGDETQRIAAAVSFAVRRSRAVVVTGGLGPTRDDRTREGIAMALGLPLERDSEALERLRRFYVSRGRRLLERHARQVERPRGSSRLANPLGTADGFFWKGRNAVLAALPGVPAEMSAMFERDVEPRLRGDERAALCTRTLKVAGRIESDVDETIRDLYATPGVEVTVLAAPTGVEIILRASGAGPDGTQAIVAGVEAEIVRRLDPDVFGRDEDTLASIVGQRLVSAGRTVATAESCTAGLLAAAMTEVPGASAWFRGGFVAYHDEIKTGLVGVPPDALANEGAVSAVVARELAVRVRERCGADYGIGVTGIAGPTGATTDKPVGLVYLAVAGPSGAVDARWRFGGDRRLVRARAVTAALDLLRRALRSG